MTETTQAPSPSFKENIIWYFSLLLTLTIICMSLGICSLVYLSQVPDITWRRGDTTYDRIFMVEIEGPAGIGHEAQRTTQTLSDNEICVTTTLSYYLWQEDTEIKTPNTTFSYIFIRSGQKWMITEKECS